MKKLLALILCVMMFVAVIPTAAFAAKGDEALPNPDTAHPKDKITLETASEYKTQIENMIKNAKKGAERAYKTLAGDQAVYNVAKSMDDIVVDLVKGLTEDMTGKKVIDSDGDGKLDKWTKTNTDTVKTAMRHLIDEKVAKEFTDNLHKTKDSDGKTDPVLYAQTFANAVQTVLTGKDFQKGIEAVATYFAIVNLKDSVDKQLKDDYKAFKSGIDNSFDKDFAANYPTLVAATATSPDGIIDTFASLPDPTAAWGDANEGDVSWTVYQLMETTATDWWEEE